MVLLKDIWPTFKTQDKIKSVNTHKRDTTMQSTKSNQYYPMNFLMTRKNTLKTIRPKIEINNFNYQQDMTITEGNDLH